MLDHRIDTRILETLLHHTIFQYMNINIYILLIHECALILRIGKYVSDEIIDQNNGYFTKKKKR